MRKRIDLTGQRFGKLTVIGFSRRVGDPCSYFECVCDCGTRTDVRGSHLRSGETKACGCLMGRHPHNKGDKRVNLKHGHTHPCTTEYKAWDNMKSRCYDTKRHNYKNYGGRGIKVCDRWRTSFENFLSDMGRKPGPEYSIDRKNNDGNYEPGNCRWATASEQRCNQRPRTLRKAS